MDLIDRQDAVDAVGSMLRRKFGIGGNLAKITLEDLPSAQPEERTEERTETHACDLISRQAAIDALMAWEENSVWDDERLKHRGEPYWVAPSDVINQMPSTQPEDTFEFGKWYDFKRGYVLETTVYSFRILKDVEASSNG